jgi:hypothetical protein
MKSNAKPSINAKMFLDYVQSVFLHHFAEFKRLDELDDFPEEMAVLLMDNCPNQITCVVLCGDEM